MTGLALISISKRIAGFAVPVAASTVLGVVTIPLLVGSIGPSSWGTLAVVQSTGQLLGILVAFGWGATGPSMVASADSSSRPQLYLESLIARGYLYLVSVAIAIVVLVFLTRGDVGISVLGSFAYLLPFLGATWYFVGESRPWRLFFFDSVPTLLGTIAGLAVAAASGSVLGFVSMQLLGSLVAVVLDALVVLRSREKPLAADFTVGSAVRSLAGQRHAVTSALTSGMYVNLPLLAVQVFLPSFVPTYAMADRFFRYANIAFSPVQQFLQGWVPEAGRAARPRRMRYATLAGLSSGILGGAIVALLAAPVSYLLSGGAIVVPIALSLPLGVAFVSVATSAVVGYACLVLVGRVRALAVSTVLGAVVGAPLIIVFAALHLPVFVACSVAVSEFIVAGYQYAVLHRALRPVAANTTLQMRTTGD